MTTTRPLEIASVDWSVIASVFVGVIMLALLCYCILVLARDKSSAPGPREEVQVQNSNTNVVVEINLEGGGNLRSPDQNTGPCADGQPAASIGA